MSASTASFTLTKLIPKPHSLSSPSPSSPFLRFTQTRTRFHSLKLSTRASATISVGDKLPEATLSHIPPSSDDPQTITISSLTANKKAILFAVPGAFTPTCSQKHLPGFLSHAAELRAKGVDTIACISVNDAFVMKAWGEAQKTGEEILMLSDGNLEFTNKIGCQLDLSDKPVGLGVRSRRYAMLVENGVVKVLNLEDGGAFNNSSAEDMLKAL